MHEQEDSELARCVDCGALVTPGPDRAYMLSDDDVLCFECAVRRGGVYDADEDRWTIPPNVAGEPDERRPHA